MTADVPIQTCTHVDAHSTLTDVPSVQPRLYRRLSLLPVPGSCPRTAELRAESEFVKQKAWTLLWALAPWSVAGDAGARLTGCRRDLVQQCRRGAGLGAGSGSGLGGSLGAENFHL